MRACYAGKAGYYFCQPLFVCVCLSVCVDVCVYLHSNSLEIDALAGIRFMMNPSGGYILLTFDLDL